MKKHILCLFDYGPQCYTGFATVSRNIVSNLKEHFGGNLKLDICAINYFGETYTEQDGTIRVISGKYGQNINGVPEQFKQGDDFGRLQFLTMLRDTDYDGIFIIIDLGVVAPIVPIIREMYDLKIKAGKKAFKSVIYFPVDGKIHPSVRNVYFNREQYNAMPKEKKQYYGEYVRQVKELSFFDRIITYTEYGKNEVLRHEPSLRNHIDVIYHGSNTHEFYPIHPGDEPDFRKEYFGSNHKKIIVALINRNQPRKDIPTAIFAFIQAMDSYKAPEHRDLFLYLHMDPEDPKGWKLRDLLSQTKLREGIDYMFPKMGDKNSQVSTETLNKIYNSIDMYLSTSLGEGWGLTTTEAMSCKVPCIIPKHTSLQEIGADGRALLLEEFLPVAQVDDNVKRYMCHYDEVSDGILKLAGELELHGRSLEQVEAAYNWVNIYTWEAVCESWIGIFQSTFFNKK